MSRGAFALLLVAVTAASCGGTSASGPEMPGGGAGPVAGATGQNEGGDSFAGESSGAGAAGAGATDNGGAPGAGSSGAGSSGAGSSGGGAAGDGGSGSGTGAVGAAGAPPSPGITTCDELRAAADAAIASAKQCDPHQHGSCGEKERVSNLFCSGCVGYFSYGGLRDARGDLARLEEQFTELGCEVASECSCPDPPTSAFCDQSGICQENTGGNQTCLFRGRIYKVGQRFGDNDMSLCTCQADGTYQCVPGCGAIWDEFDSLLAEARACDPNAAEPPCTGSVTIAGDCGIPSWWVTPDKVEALARGMTDAIRLLGELNCDADVLPCPSSPTTHSAACTPEGVCADFAVEAE